VFYTRPNTVKLELVEGCSLFCDFCGIRGIRERAGGPYKFVSLELVHRLAGLVAEAGWNSRFELAMRGEPTMHPQVSQAVAILRRHLPQASLMMTSNGTGLLRCGDSGQAVVELFAAGLNCLVLDNYDGVTAVPRILSQCAEHGIRVGHYPEDVSLMPYKRWLPSQHELVVFPDIRKTGSGVHRSSDLSNHCGAAAPRNNRQSGKRCVRPFRELVVRYDGQVPICCDDWRGELRMGSILECTSIEMLWQNGAFASARRLLFRGRRQVGPCFGCDSRSTRPGLVCVGNPPELATDRDVELLYELVGNGPMTVPVLREWEVR
jgi:hypothetical protein